MSDINLNETKENIDYMKIVKYAFYALIVYFVLKSIYNANFHTGNWQCTCINQAGTFKDETSIKIYYDKTKDEAQELCDERQYDLWPFKYECSINELSH